LLTGSLSAPSFVTGSAPQAPRLQGGVKERGWIAVYSYPGSPALWAGSFTLQDGLPLTARVGEAKNLDRNGP
jgi:hypothetical protein